MSYHQVDSLSIHRTSPQPLAHRDMRSPGSARLAVAIHPASSSTTLVLQDRPYLSSTRLFLVRALALLCACALSIGSHYGSYVLSPLKSRLSREMGTSNTEFSLLISAFSLNSTWTPLVGGLVASKLGTTRASILATGIIFAGQALLLFGDLTEDVRLMAFGMFIFGLGVSPLAVVQETIIVRFFRGHGLGISMALGLVAGKGASFVSANASYPLSQKYGPHAPFYLATFLAAFSVVVNLIYLAVSKWLVDTTGVEPEPSEILVVAVPQSPLNSGNFSSDAALNRIAQKRKVNLRDVLKLGDVFWAYIGLNVLCGMLWSPFTHLAANLIERRYDLTEMDAANKASYLLAGSIFLYPIVGFAIDRIKISGIIIRMFILSALLTLFAYVWLALPASWTETPIPAIVSFASGVGFAPLLLVVIVPQLVPQKYVSTTLGAHKSLEQTGTTIFQTLAGLVLDSKKSPVSSRGYLLQNKRALQYLLNVLVSVNVLQLICLWALFYLGSHQHGIDVDDDDLKLPSHGDESVSIDSATESSTGERSPLLHPVHPIPSIEPRPISVVSNKTLSKHERVRWRGQVFAWLSAALVASAWILFMTVAYLKLRSKEERGSPRSLLRL